MSLFPRTAHTLMPNVRVSLTARNGRHSLTNLTQRSSIAGRRHNHILAAAGETVRLTADAFSWVHSSLGVPWYITIPMLAVGVNITFRLPLQLYVARQREKRSALNPLIAAWTQRHATTIARDQSHLPERIARLRIAGSTEKSRRRIYKTFGAQRWKSLAPVLSMIPFISISEALRRNCGAPLGWISHSLGLGQDGSAQTAASMLDPTLINGGILWFTDLTSMDPYFGLPVLCTALLGWTTWGRMPREHLQALLTIGPPDKSTTVPMTNLSKMLGRTMLLVPIFPLLFSDLPSAIFLYWASSFALTNANEVVLNRYITKKPPKLTFEAKESSAVPYLVGRVNQKE
ncbi:hypothetical protein G7046_g9893 [Stylonectria norvegica]|nr:hypothetical protein G7046_g9893 [Stylonectria norvegica]